MSRKSPELHARGFFIFAAKYAIIIDMNSIKEHRTSKRYARNLHAQSRSFGWAFALILLAQFAATTALVVALGRLNLLQPWQYNLTLVILYILFALNLILLFRVKAKAGQIIAVILAIVITIICAFGYKYVRQTVTFVEKITGAEYETQTYKVLSLKNSAYDKVELLARQHVGFLNTNPNLDATHAALKNVVDYKNTDYAELGELVAGIYDHKVAAVVLNEDYLTYLEEEADTTFVEDARVIYEFEVRADALDLRKAVDVVAEPFIIYISGSDSRGSIKQVARSDVNIVAVVNPQKAKILLISIPRDYYVRLHGTTGNLDKLTHAGVYGINMSKTTIEDLLGIQVNYTVKVGFQTVIKVVDALDGIDIESDQALKLGKCTFVKGLNKSVNSECALAFARERKSYSTGDRHRGQNQQHVIAQIIAKMSDPHYAVRYSDILAAADGSFETSLTYDEITNFARSQLNSMRKWSVESIQLDGTGSMQPTYSMGAQKLYVMIPDQATITATQAKIREYLGQAPTAAE